MVLKRQTLSVIEAAKSLGISKNAAYMAIHRGELPYIRIGKRILVSVVQLERMLDGGQVKAS
ncbi:helix-turn-helix domain-containing protein [Chloroflexota bacterium]